MTTLRWINFGLVGFSLLFGLGLTAQVDEVRDFPDAEQGKKGTTVAKTDDLRRFERVFSNALRVAFYNVENLFDLEDDPNTNDDDFTPTGIKAWGSARYREKQSNVYKTLIALGGWSPPAIIGFCEIENRFVLADLIAQTPLKQFDYQVIHKESPDARGIDVGLIYRPEMYQPLENHWLKVVFPFSPESKTRDVLYTKGLVFQDDTIHIFINHWPSKFGGAQASEPRRMFVGELIRKVTDSILTANPRAQIIITGDFNDEPGDKSLLEGLGAMPDTNSAKPLQLVNLMYPQFKKGLGTEKYQSHWGLLDHFIVSQPLLNGKGSLRTAGGKAHIFDAAFLITEDEKYLGTMPFRTYAGPKYLGGYSDHFPVFMDLIPNKK
jgi:hypothetical protein